MDYRNGPTLTPHLVCKNAAGAIEFYKNAFGATEVARMLTPDGRLMHGELKIGNSTLMIADDFPEWCGGKSHAPEGFGGSPVTINLLVPNVDEVFARAVKLGATSTMPVADMFWGDRYGKLRDPFGHEWALLTHIKDLTTEEIQKAQAAMFAKFKH